jgi:Protein of unknown function (DUF3667)
MSPEASTTVVTTSQPADPAVPAPKSDLRHESTAPPSCANCGAAVTGKYCGACGQRLEHSVHSVWHFAREATEDLTHADSRLWRTLAALLFKPGYLTREFLAGRRARYLPPLRLYLVVSVFFFLVIGSQAHVGVLPVRDGSGGKPSVSTQQSTEEFDALAKPGETRQQHIERVCHPDYNGPAKSFIEPFMRKNCQMLAEDHGRSVAEAFMHNVARAMFLFLPVLALIMMTMYWHPRRYFVEHLLFFVHIHAFAFLLLALETLIARFVPDSLGDSLGVLVTLYIAYYLFAAMRRVYGQGRFRTFAKLTVLSFAYVFGFAVMMALTGVYSVWSV